MARIIPVLLQIILPLTFIGWHARARQRTLSAYMLLTAAAAAWFVVIAVADSWVVAPWYMPFVYFLALGASAMHRAPWIRSLPVRPHGWREWTEMSNYLAAFVAATILAVVVIASRPISNVITGAIDVTTLNLYRQLGSSVVGMAMLMTAIKSPRWGRMLLSGIFVYAAGTNLRIAMTTPQDYLAFSEYAVLDVYRQFILGFFALHTAEVIGAIAIGQAAIAFLLATNGWPRRLGYYGAIVFLLAIVPLGVGSGFPCTVLMALAAVEVLHADHYAVFGRNVNATDEELAMELPGDAFIARPFGIATHAVTIFKPAHDVWPWLVQMGAGRGGWYSYDRLDNGGQPSATKIVPELQKVKVGMVFPGLPGVKDNFIVERLDEGHSLVLAVPGPRGFLATWAFALEEPAPDVTRLIVRARIAYRPLGLPKTIGMLGARMVHFIMERKQLNGLVARVERF